MKTEKKMPEKIEKSSVKTEENKEEHVARAKALNLPISPKVSREIAAFVRNKNTIKAKGLLQNVMEQKIAIPMKRFNRDTGHKPGKIAAGRYHQKATNEFIKLIKLVEAHADNKGMDSKNLIIFDIRANKGEKMVHYGRQRGTKMKRANLYIGVKEKWLRER